MNENHQSIQSTRVQPASVRDWHRPRDPQCAHNVDPAEDCTCTRQRQRKPFRVVRVEDVSAQRGGKRHKPKLVFAIWPNGVIKVREHGCRREYVLTASSIFVQARYADAMQKLRESGSKRAKSKKGSVRRGRR